MPRPTPFPSTDYIVITFNAWLKNNHDELLKDTGPHLLSTIRNQWNALITEFTDSLLEKHKRALEDLRSNTYPEGKE